MKYLFSDFYLLVSLADKTCHTVGDAYRRMSELMGIPVSPSCLAHGLRGLCAGGYATIAPDTSVITVDTPIEVTALGREAATVSGLQKLFGEEKAFNKKELRFCQAESPAEGALWTVDAPGFSAVAEKLLQDRTVSYPLFDLAEDGEGQLTVTIHHPARDYAPTAEDSEPADETASYASDPDAAATVDSISVTGSEEQILPSMSQLLETAYALITAPRTYKTAFHGARGSYVVSLAHTASEYGIALRLTVAQIRFNRQRFYGKRDGDLDYAQCGEPVITTEMSGAKEFAARLLPCLVSLPERLSEEDCRVLEALHIALKK